MRTVLLLAATTLLFSCSKKNKNGEGGGCGDSPYIPPQAFSSPVWHPGGQIFTFTYLPIAGIKTSPCLSKMLEVKTDSMGQYFMKKDGSSLTKSIAAPYSGSAWNQDGSKFVWIEFDKLFEADYNTSTLAIITRKLLYQGSMSGAPMFNTAGDSVYVHTLLSGTYGIRRIAMDASGSTEIKQGTFREVVFGSNNRFYYINNNWEIWSMDKNGNDVTKEVAADANALFRTNPRYYNGNLYYVEEDKLVCKGNNTPLVNSKVTNFAISPQGEIIYNQYRTSSFEDNKQNGTFWIMNADGSNKRQLTFNNY